MGFLSDNKPYTAVTSTIDRLTTDQYEIDDISEVVELIEVIKIQWTGPTEAARAIRKKLKYGSPHAQLRALTILEALVSNGGRQLAPLYNDDQLLERLRLIATSQQSQTTTSSSGSGAVNSKVRRRMQSMFIGWRDELKDVKECSRLAQLYTCLPKQRARAQSDVRGSRHATPAESSRHRDRDDDSDGGRKQDRNEGYSGDRDRDRERLKARLREEKPQSRSRSMVNDKSSWGSSRRRRRSSNLNTDINIVKEAPKIKELLAESGTAATNLQNVLQHINIERELACDNRKAVELFNKAKSLRHKVLKYIHNVQSEEYIGPLIHANEELVNALKQYEKKSLYPEENYNTDDDSGSDSDSDVPSCGVRQMNISTRSPPPPRPTSRPPSLTPQLSSPTTSAPASRASPSKSMAVEEEDETDPFGDRHESAHAPIHTPMW